MTITLNGTTGITTPDLTVDTDTLVVDEANNRVGIGTSSPSTLLEVNGSGVPALLNSSNNQYVLKMSYANSTSSAYLGTFSNALILAPSSAVEAARIDSSGNLLVGTTGTAFGIGTFLAGSGQNVLGVSSAGAVNGTRFVRFNVNTSTEVGSITTTGSATAYNTSSDYRLKEDWQPMTGASERVKALNPVNFAWKADGSRVDGFLAHEAQAVVPECVTGTKDAVELVDIKDEEGNVTGQEERPVYQGIDQSKLVPLLTAALQEALAEIETLKARVSALEAA